jgi:hypothetical protein
VTNYLEDMFVEFDHAAKKSLDGNDKHIIIDKIYENVDYLSVFPFNEVLSRIVDLIERYPELDYGGPGPFGSFIEEHKTREYAQTLIDSLYRQPTTQILGFLGRASSGNDFQDGNAMPPELREKFRECLHHVTSNPKASDECKDFAAICLKDMKQRII